ncbi:unnamed protein product [Hermetia illucens]|uniref:Uncharacterized protein n=1 Tax=Hermetia illucens TaxID=343691 RepID=A0A7R8UYD7_HERIL|nr:unnamed protein product [Hermetia illucens]
MNISHWNIELICRTDSFLSVQFDVDFEDATIGGVVYKIFAHGQQPNYYLVDKMPNINFASLMQNSTYNLSVIVYGKDMEMVARSQDYQFSTLSKNYIPGSARNITLHDIKIDKSNPKKVKALLKWEPSEDRNCQFEIESTTGGESTVNTQRKGSAAELFTSEIKNISMGGTLDVRIRGKRMGGWYMQGSRVEKTFKIPSCFEFYNDNLTICEPEKPQDLQLELNYPLFRTPSMVISWTKSRLPPDFYELMVSISVQGSPISTSKLRIDGDVNSTIMRDFGKGGSEIEVTLEAHSGGGVSKTTIVQLMPRVELEDKDMVVIALFAIAVSLSLFLPTLVFAVYLINEKAKSNAEKNQQSICKDERINVAEWLEKKSNDLY